MNRKTTAKEFARFRAAFGATQKRLGCLDYAVQFRLQRLTDRWAQISMDTEGHLATVDLADTLTDEAPDLDRLGRHEAIHLLVGRIAELGKERYVSEREMNEAEEAVVRLLEQAL